MGDKDRPACQFFSQKALMRAMKTMQEKYGVRFRFCDGRSTGKELIDYLTGVKS